MLLHKELVSLKNIELKGWDIIPLQVIWKGTDWLRKNAPRMIWLVRYLVKKKVTKNWFCIFGNLNSILNLGLLVFLRVLKFGLE